MDGDQKLCSIYLIHSLPLEMSVIQLFLGDQMSVVAHLVGRDTIGRETSLHLDDEFAYFPWRAMLIKDNAGDWGICAGAWKGMSPGKPGVPGTRYKRGIPGKPGMIFLTYIISRFSRIISEFCSRNSPEYTFFPQLLPHLIPHPVQLPAFVPNLCFPAFIPHFYFSPHIDSRI